MKVHPLVRRQINLAAGTVRPALVADLLNDDTSVDLLALDSRTQTIQTVLRATRSSSTAVYIVWDRGGTCRYVGSVRRPSAAAAVRDRISEHLAAFDDRRATWFAVTVLAVREDLGLEILRLCEGWVARRLRPVDGSAHPKVSADVSVGAAIDRLLTRR